MKSHEALHVVHLRCCLCIRWSIVVKWELKTCTSKENAKVEDPKLCACKRKRWSALFSPPWKETPFFIKRSLSRWTEACKPSPSFSIGARWHGNTLQWLNQCCLLVRAHCKSSKIRDLLFLYLSRPGVSQHISNNLRVNKTYQSRPFCPFEVLPLRPTRTHCSKLSQPELEPLPFHH